MSQKRTFSMFVVIIFFLSLIPLASAAANITIEKQSSGEVLVIDTGTPVTFDLKITNNGPGATFEFYNLLGFEMNPEKVSIGSGETEEVKLELTPLGTIKERGYYTMSYYIKRSDAEQEQKTLTFKIIGLKDAFSIGAGYLDPESEEVEVFIKNKEGVDFGNVSAKFDSTFFNFKRDFTLKPYETKTFVIPVSEEKLKGVSAGFYTLTADIQVGDEEAPIEDTIRFVEKNIVTTTKSDFGFLLDTEIVEKSNEGNVAQQVEVIVEKNIIPRLFTSFSPEPDISERRGTSVRYTWIREIQPGETFQVSVKTNWLLPFIIILFIAVIIFMTKKYTQTNLLLRKRVSFVKARGGEFALKVSILVSSKKYLERVNVIDRLPALVDVHERFGGEQPSRIDKKNRKIEWNFEKLEAGERRILSYVIYSKVGVFGRFALPPATAIYEKEGEIQESESNRAYFVSEQRAPRKESDSE